MAGSSFLSIALAVVSYVDPRVSAPVTVEAWPDFQPPLVVIDNVGGTHDGYRVHDAVIDVDAFAASRQDAEALAWEVDSALHDMHGIEHRGLVVTRVNVTGAPRAVSYGNPNVRRLSATYRLTFHAAT